MMTCQPQQCMRLTHAKNRLQGNIINTQKYTSASVQVFSTNMGVSYVCNQQYYHSRLFVLTGGGDAPSHDVVSVTAALAEMWLFVPGNDARPLWAV